MNTYILLSTILTLCHGALYTEWSSCKSWKETDGDTISTHCDDTCSDLGDSSTTCSYTGDVSSCSMTCGTVFCSGTSKCECECSSDCSFDDDIMADPSECGFSLLTEVDDQIEEQIAFEVSGAIVGNIPVVGALFDIAWSAWDPVSPITNSLALGSEIIAQANTAMSQILECVDEKIDDALTEVRREDMNYTLQGMMQEYQLVIGASGDTQTEYIRIAFADWVGDIPTMYAGTEDDYFAYLGLLSFHKAIVPLWTTVVLERLIYLGYISNDTANYMNERDISLAVFEYLLDWIQWAETSIEEGLEASIVSNECRNEDDMYSALDDWMDTFDELYIDPVETSIYNTVFLDLSTYNGSSRTFQIQSDWKSDYCIYASSGNFGMISCDSSDNTQKFYFDDFDTYYDDYFRIKSSETEYCISFQVGTNDNLAVKQYDCGYEYKSMNWQISEWYGNNTVIQIVNKATFSSGADACLGYKDAGADKLGCGNPLTWWKLIFV